MALFIQRYVNVRLIGFIHLLELLINIPMSGLLPFAFVALGTVKGLPFLPQMPLWLPKIVILLATESSRQKVEDIVSSSHHQKKPG